jgi:hypothetical protein
MSWPNHMLTQSGTSCGLTRTGIRCDDDDGSPHLSFLCLNIPATEDRLRSDPRLTWFLFLQLFLGSFDKGGGPTKTYPQFTIYDSMALDNVSFGTYINVSCGLRDQPACTDGSGTTPGAHIVLVLDISID